MPSAVIFWTTSTMKDEKYAAKFHYIKTAFSEMEFYNKHPDNSKGVWTFALQTIWTTDVWATWVGRLDHMPEYNNMQQKLFCGRKQLANSKFPKADLYPHPLRQANHSVKSANYASFMLDVYFKNITASYDTI